MGTKRDPSSPLMENDTVKRQNIEQFPPSSSKEEKDMENSEFLQDMKQMKEELRKEFAEAMKKVGDELRDEIAMVSKKIGEICVSHGSVVNSLQFHSDYLESLNNKMSNIDLGAQIRDGRMDKIEHGIREQKTKLTYVNREVQDYGREVKAKNIVINGLSEKKGENTVKVAATFLKNFATSIDAKDIENAYRMGAPGEAKRSILVKFKTMDTKKEVMAKKSSLKDKKNLKKVYCNEDLTENTRKTRQTMREIGRFAVKSGYKNVKVTGSKIIIDGVTYYDRDLLLLPKELHIENIKVRLISGRICFEGEMAFLSSSYHSPIKMNDEYFGSVDQAFFYHKAIYTGRTDYASQILDYNDAKTLRKMGKKIEPDADWEEKQLKVLKGITILKFQQNPVLKRKLIGTGDTPLYNCDLDIYWGTGRSMDSTQWDDLMQYSGRNALGIVLQDVRERLKPPGYRPTNQSLNLSKIDVSAITQELPTRPSQKSLKKTPMSKESVPSQDPRPEALEGKNTTTETPKAMAAKIIPTEIPMITETAVLTEQPQDTNTSVGSIDQEGVLLKLLHKKLGTVEKPPETSSVGLGNEPAHTHPGNHSCSSEAIDLDESTSASVESVSATSSVVGDVVDPADLTLSDGKLDKDKMSSLTFATANISKSLEKSFLDMKKIHKKDKVSSFQDASHSTPAPVSTVLSRRRTSKRHIDQKAKTDALLLELGL